MGSTVVGLKGGYQTGNPGWCTSTGHKDRGIHSKKPFPKWSPTWPMQWGKLLVPLARTFNRGSNSKAHRSSLLMTVTQNTVSSGYQGAFLSLSQAIAFGFEKAFGWIYTKLEDNSGSQGESKLTFRMIPKGTSFYHALKPAKTLMWT